MARNHHKFHSLRSLCSLRLIPSAVFRFTRAASSTSRRAKSPIPIRRAERRRDRWYGNPKGIGSSSPAQGLPSPRGYPGLACVGSSTPTGLGPRSTIGPQPRWPTPPAFPRGASRELPRASGWNPFGIQLWNSRKAGAQILAALDYKPALRHSSCGTPTSNMEHPTWNIQHPTSNSGHPFPLTLPSPQRLVFTHSLDCRTPEASAGPMAAPQALCTSP